MASACFAILGITFQRWKLLCLVKDHWWVSSTLNVHMVHIVIQIRFNMVYTSEYKSLLIYNQLSWNICDRCCVWTEDYHSPRAPRFFIHGLTKWGGITLRNTTKYLWRWEPDRRSNLFSPPAVIYITKITLHVTLSNQSHPLIIQGLRLFLWELSLSYPVPFRLRH